jgi:hypothetical protein
MSVDLLDTNILVYYFQDADPRKGDIARKLVRDGIRTGSAVIATRSCRRRSTC